MTKVHKLSVSLNDKQLRLLNQYAKENGGSASDSLKMAVSAGLNELERQRETRAEDFKQVLAGLKDAVEGRAISERQFHVNMKRRLTRLRKQA